MFPTNQEGLFKLGGKKGRYLTVNLTPSLTFFDSDNEVVISGVHYREVDPRHSKFVAAIAKGLQQTGITKNSVMLYLGASHGYTPSFFSDIMVDGMIFALDFSPRVVRDLYMVCEKRLNMAPLLADASQPDSYADLVPEVDVVYQDIAQRNQVSIFVSNCDKFLKPEGFGLLALKARSVDVTKKPSIIFKETKRFFERSNYTIIDYRELDPYEKDHAFFVVKKRR